MFSRTLSNVVLGLIVLIWVIPFAGLLTTSIRSQKATLEFGFWQAYTPTEIGHGFRTHIPFDEPVTRIEGNIFERLNESRSDYNISGEVQSIMTRGRVIDPEDETKTILQRKLFFPGEVLDVRDGDFVFQANGDFVWTFVEPTNPRPKTLDVYINQDPAFGVDAYVQVLNGDKSVVDALVASFIVTIPATVIPITIAAFAAYAFAWMRFPGRNWIFVAVVSLMVVPTQLAFFPILNGFTQIAEWSASLNAWMTGCDRETENCRLFSSKSYAGLWITHTAFGLPLAIYLLRNYIVGLPKELLESARIDGASHLQIFVRLIVPLSVPALASFAIFQFLWVWNDLLVALFIGPSGDIDKVFPIILQGQLGTFGDKLHLLNASAVLSMIIPICVFLAMQRYFVRGLLAGSVKGG